MPGYKYNIAGITAILYFSLRTFSYLKAKSIFTAIILGPQVTPLFNQFHSASRYKFPISSSKMKIQNAA